MIRPISRKTTIILMISLLCMVAIPAAGGKAMVLPQTIGADGIRRVTTDELRAALKEGKAVLVDVRGEGAYRAGHIKGALLMPINEIGSRYGELPKNKLIATYCS
jgi:predicted sulfurtransferase